MEKNINALPGYRISEYVLMLNPHEDLRNRIVTLKRDFSEKFSLPGARRGIPAITLATFVQYEMMEERIKNRLQVIGMGHHRFKVELKDFGSFPTHSIFINVTSKLPVQDLVKKIRTETQRLMKLDSDHKPYFVTEPHINIARKLKPWQYEQGWKDFSHKHFTARFIADGMLMLKRPVGGTKYEIVKRFEFQNLPVTTIQADLFG